MCRKIKRKKFTGLSAQGGFTLVEVLIGALIFATMLATVLTVRSFMARQTTRVSEKAFAVEKAMQMLEELRALVAGQEKSKIVILDDFNDGDQYPALLTTDQAVSDPASPLSGNTFFQGSWKFIRQILVSPLPSDPYARRVEVRVFRNDPNNPGQPLESLAEVVGVLKTISDEYFPTQVYDVYVLALENVPGWWVLLPQIRNVLIEVFDIMQKRNPGLEFRVHEIKRLSYGRDPYYAPYVNAAQRANSVQLPYVYLYPGNIDGTNWYYDPNLFEGKIHLDNTLTAGYPLADRYNHAVRYPEELELFQAYGHKEPSLRMLIEEMNANPDNFKNALIMNLHGELVPLPPLRNYSDAAKDPVNYPNVRIVTHPENLQYSGGSAVTLRVYPYVTNPGGWSTNAVLADATLRIIPQGGANLDLSQVTVYKMVGNDTVPYAWQTAVPNVDFYYDQSGSDLILNLKNTPLRHPENVNPPSPNQGLNTAYRLYGMEYVPCPTHPGSTAAFTFDLNDASNRPHNTARWRIHVNAGALANGQHEVQTWIGPPSAAAAYPNLSRTWVWVGVAPPITEQYQFQGDPRHLPYADVKNNGGYNWFFTTVNNSTWPGYSNLRNGWSDPDDSSTSSTDVDVPRLFLVLREGLMKAGAIWTTLNGFSYYYYGMGGEIGYDKAPFPSSIPTGAQPWNSGTVTGNMNVQEITGGVRIAARKNGSWESKPWLGELYPDDVFSAWQSTGNLPSSTNSVDFYRKLPTYNYSTPRRARLHEEGCISFFNGTPSGNSGTFRHEYRDGDTATLLSPGSLLMQFFNMPLLSTINASRPYRINWNLVNNERPPEWAAYSGWRTVLSIPRAADSGSLPLRVYYEASYQPSDFDATGVIRMKRSGKTAYVVVSGLDFQSNFGAGQMGRLALATMMGTLLDAGLYSAAEDRIPQVPRVDLLTPESTFDEVDPVTITVSWDQTWQRWDGQKYTPDYSSGYVEPGVQVVYNLKYSRNARDWYFVQDDQPAQVGVLDTGRAVTFAGAPPHTYTWNVLNLSRGTVYLRVEGYRKITATGKYLPLHYAYDQVRFYLSK